MKNITVTFIPAESIAKKEAPKTYPYQSGQPMPEVGEKVTFDDWTKSYTVTARSFHYVSEDTLQIFFQFDSK